MLKELHNTENRLRTLSILAGVLYHLPGEEQIFRRSSRDYCRAGGLALTCLPSETSRGKIAGDINISVDDLPDFKDYTMDGRTYRYFKGETAPGVLDLDLATPLLHMEVPASSPSGSEVKVAVDVTNTGNIDGEGELRIRQASCSGRWRAFKRLRHWKPGNKEKSS